MRKLQVAIIGCGKHPYNFHIPSFKRLSSKFKIIGVYDKNLKRAEITKKKFKIKKIYKKIDDLINDNEIDLVDICSPATKHYSHILRLIKKQYKNIIVEKPFVTQIKHFDHLIKNKKKNLKLICLGQQRYREETQSLKKFLIKNKMKLGNLLRIEGKAIYRSKIPEQIENSFTNKNLSGGGPLIDHGSHILDLIFYLFPNLEVKKIYPYLFKNNLKKNIVYNVEESALVNILFSNKVVLNFETSYISPRPKDDFGLSLYFQRGYVTWPNLKCFYVNKVNSQKIKFNKNKLASDNQFLKIYELIKKNKKYNLASTRKVIKIIEYCYKNNML